MNKNIKKYAKLHKNEFNQIQKLIKKYDKIVVFRHVSPDFDAIGTQLGLANYLKQKYPFKEIHAVGEDSVQLTGFTFPPMDILEDSWFEQEFLAIIVDVSDPKRISDERFNKAKKIAVIDHHPNSETFSTINCTDTAAAAAGEIVASMLYYFEKGTSIGYHAARNLYIAIAGDSGRFQYSSTTSLTFALAQELIDEGLVLPEIYSAMYEEDIKSLNITKKLLENYKVTEHNAIYYVLTNEDQQEIGIEQGEAKGFVHTFAGIRNVPIWSSITEDIEKGCFWVSIRSKVIPVNKIAEKWRGGGHDQAAGCKLLSLDEVPAFAKDLDDAIVEWNRNQK